MSSISGLLNNTDSTLIHLVLVHSDPMNVRICTTVAHLFFASSKLTETFPKATKMGLGLGGGSCKRERKKKNQPIKQIWTSNISIASRLRASDWFVSLPLSLQTDTYICALPASWFPPCRAPEPPWFAPPAKDRWGNIQTIDIAAAAQVDSTSTSGNNLTMGARTPTHSFDRLDGLLACRCCFSLSLSRNLQEKTNRFSNIRVSSDSCVWII